MSSNNNITTTWQDQLKEAESLNIASRFAFRHSYKTCKWRIEIGILPSSEQRTEDDRLDEEERGVTMVQLPSIAAASCCRLLLAAGGAGCCWHCWSPAATPLTLLVATVMLLRWSSVVAGCFGAIFKLFWGRFGDWFVVFVMAKNGEEEKRREGVQEGGG